MRRASASRLCVEPGVVIAGTRYRALQRVGARAGAAVYEVEHQELGRQFTLRMLASELVRWPDVVRRARAEWQALGKLRHPNLARVTDAGVTAWGAPYCVTEQLAGKTLRQHLTRRRSITVPVALAIARELASVLAAAHAVGVAHGNLQPDVVILTRGGCSKLCNFGSYEIEAFDLAACMRSDVYGLGLVLFEMVAGRSALRASRRRRSGEGRARGRPRLVDVVPGVSPAVSEIVAKLLAPDPRERPALSAVIAELRCVELRYQRQVSTTQETVHYDPERLVRASGAALARGAGSVVPLPSQTLEGIPWTVTRACSEQQPDSRRPAAGESPRARASDSLLRPSRRQVAIVVRSLPARVPPRRRPGLRLMLVLGCSLLVGVLAGSVAHGSAAGEVGRLGPGQPPARALR